MTNQYKIETRVYPDGVIESDFIHYDPISDIGNTISRTLIDTRETQIRESLIALGWTPPEKV